MKRFLTALSVVICAIGFLIQASRGQDPAASAVPTSFPVVPIAVEFRLVPQFFRQPLTRDSKYSSIDAFVDNSGNSPWYEIILREKASSKQVYYCNSQQTVAMLSGRGEQAYYAPIDFNSAKGADSNPVFTFRFQDNSQTSILWHFVEGPPATGRNGEDRFMARPDDSGFVLLRLHEPMSAAQGTTLSIGDEQNAAGPDALYAADVVLAEIPPITQQWNVASAPGEIRTNGKWVLRNKTGTESQLTIQKVSGDQISMSMQNPDSQDSAMQLDAQQSADQYGLSSMTVSSKGHSLRLSFQPALPLPAAMTNDKTEVKFAMDEDGQMGVASGRLTAVRGLGDEHLQWQFDVPDWAKSKRLDTGVSVLFGAETKELKQKQNPKP